MLGDGAEERRRSSPGGSKKLKSEPAALFLHRLAIELGEPSVDALASKITVKEFRRWCGYYLLEPFGTDWQRTARLAVWLAVTLGAKFDPDDEIEQKFLPTYRSVPQTDDEILRELMKIPALRRRREEGE